MKKNYLIWQYILSILSFTILIPSSHVHGQEYIKNVPMTDSYSIVRNVDQNRNLLYNHGKDNRFYMEYLGNTSCATQSLNKEDMKILDFEIFEDLVFFCGLEDTVSPNAVFGCFNLSDFPSSIIYYDVRDGMR